MPPKKPNTKTTKKTAQTQEPAKPKEQQLLFIKPLAKPSAPLESKPEPLPQPQAEATTTETPKESVTPVKPTLIQPPETTTRTPESPTEEQPQQETTKPQFQAIGVISGELIASENNSLKICIKGKFYDLRYIKGWKTQGSYEYLYKQVVAGNIKNTRLVVYPQIIHFPSRELKHRIYFQVRAFQIPGQEPTHLLRIFKDFEFTLSGLWQFIPVCRTPCISVFKNNNSKERWEFLKNASILTKARFMKAQHLPLIWKESPVAPYRFNPRLEKEEQGKRYFVTIKANFIPSRDCFGFNSLISPPSESAPRFYKLRKEDKAEALKMRQELKKLKQATEGLNLKKTKVKVL